MDDVILGCGSAKGVHGGNPDQTYRRFFTPGAGDPRADELSAEEQDVTRAQDKEEPGELDVWG